MKNTTQDLVTAFTKQYGDGTAQVGAALDDVERIPTGFFAFDLATGGGFPKGKQSIVYGPESSGKTNLALVTIARYQKDYPNEACAFIDVENSYDPEWAAKLGVDNDKIILIKPDFAEQAVDMCEALVSADDCGLVVFDSIGALIRSKEVEDEADKAAVGGSAIVVGKLCRKIMVACLKAQKEKRYPTVLYINQVRKAIGVMYGDPEHMPGGEQLKHASGLTIRLYGKNLMDNAVSDRIPARKLSKVIIKKNKCPIFATHAEYEMIVVPHGGLACGQTDDAKTLYKYLAEAGWIGKEDKGYFSKVPTLGEVGFLKQGDLKDWIATNQKAIAKQLIEHLLCDEHDAVGVEVGSD